MFQVGKRAGRPQHLVHQRIRRHRRDLIVDSGQLVIFGRDQLRGLLGNMRIARQNGGDRLADITHFFERQYRLIVKGGTVIRFRNELAYILAGNNAMHTRKCLRSRGIDAADASVRHGRAKNLAIQHAGHAQIMRIVGAAAYFGARFKARKLSTDLVHYCRSPAPRSIACCTARPR
jgi:hypothetical protein